MKRFLSNILIFGFPILVVLIAIWFLQPPSDFRFHYIKGDCSGRADWIRQRIDLTNAPIDMLFLGSSRTMNAVNDQLLDSLFREADQHLGFANFGYCRLGRDLQYLLFLETLEKHPLKMLVLEVREKENLYSHPIYSHIAERPALFSAPIKHNKSYVPNLLNNWLMHLSYCQKRLLGLDEVPIKETSLYSYQQNKHIADPAFLAEKRKAIKFHPPKAVVPEFPKYYLEEIIRLCEIKGIQLFFLYILENGSKNAEPAGASFYANNGKLLTPALDLMESDNYWMDNIHLNEYGAQKMTKWFFDQIIEIVEITGSCKE